MCGIAGFVGNLNKSESLDNIKNMLSFIRHRGPDENGAYIGDKVCIGSVRLSIVDMKSGTMPISNADKSMWIVFNGEIYNHIELRNDLIKRGLTFETNSDTEVVIKLYEVFGPDCLQKLNGQFSIAIWDCNKAELFLARDRVGIRPLYYTFLDECFLFGSEIKSFLGYPGVNFEFCEESLADYFTLWTSVSPKTVFKNIFEVKPGSYMILRKGKLIENIYWDIPITKENDYEFNSLNDSKLEFDKLFQDSIRLRLRADVPVAAYLSGGIDSAVTTSYIVENGSSKLKTFSIGFSDEEFDESSYQNEAVQYFKTTHSQVLCSSKDISKSFKETVWFCEAPILRTAPIPMKLLSNFVKNNDIKVVITGEGSDELLGGYNIFKEAKIRHFWSKDPSSRLRPLLLKRLYPYLPHINKSTSNGLKLFFGYKLNETDSPIYSHLLRWNNTSRLKNYFSNSVKSKQETYNPINQIEKSLEEKLVGCDYMMKAQYIELKMFMSGYLLSSQGDRMAMANSIEGRYPFLDHRIIEFCMKLSPSLKLRGLNEKYLLKKVIKDRIPESILMRSKQAYRAPIRSALISDPIDPYLKTMLNSSTIKDYGIFNYVIVDKLKERLLERKTISEMDNMALSGILSIQILYDMFINRNFPKYNGNKINDFDKVIIEN